MTGTFDGFSQAPLLHYLRERPEVLATMLLEDQLLPPPANARRVHTVFREAP